MNEGVYSTFRASYGHVQPLTDRSLHQIIAIWYHTKIYVGAKILNSVLQTLFLSFHRRMSDSTILIVVLELPEMNDN